jgi:DNA adenine methylase
MRKLAVKVTSGMNSPFRYAGGKFYARGQILPLLPKHKFYVEPFSGGASIFFAKEKTESWLNDIDEGLMNCLIHIRDFPTELAARVCKQPATKERHNYFKNEYRPRTPLDLAVRWYFLNRTSYSGIMNMQNCYFGYGDKFSMRPENWTRNIARTSEKLQGVRLTSMDFVDVIRESPKNSLLFIDPPYFKADQSKFYTHSFLIEDHMRLVDVLKSEKRRVKFFLTYDDCEEVRDMYSFCDMSTAEWNYTINRTDDQKKTKSVATAKDKGKRYKGQELFITNY